ncbi:alpha/beta fold hydrolase [Streptomyces sp. NPDC002328]|uniref:alpha/beta fold hydrolase n=1 Tax=Streptomyces sp. NPDC002328 TaxID=3364642 RepID=UPI0036C0C75F
MVKLPAPDLYEHRDSRDQRSGAPLSRVPRPQQHPHRSPPAEPCTCIDRTRRQRSRRREHRVRGPRDRTCRGSSRVHGHVKGRLARYAYRDFGKDAPVPPLVLLQRFRGTLDHWDPAFLEVLAQDRRIIDFDNAGVSESTGDVPTTREGMAESAFDFLTALGLDEVDLLGWSVGGFVAQLVTLRGFQPERIVLVEVIGMGERPAADLARFGDRRCGRRGLSGAAFASVAVRS